MTQLVKVLHFTNILCTALVAGGQVLISMVILPVKRRWSVGRALQLHQDTLDHMPDRYLKPTLLLSGATVGASSLILLVQRKFKRSIALVTFTNLLGMIGVIATSRYFNVRTNKMMKTWTEESIPANYRQIEQRWDKIHLIRTASGILTLVSAILAGLLNER
jgi:hypothetical protein